MSFDPASYIVGKTAGGGGGGGGGSVLVPLRATDVGTYTPVMADGFSSVEVDIPAAEGKTF